MGTAIMVFEKVKNNWKRYNYIIRNGTVPRTM